MCWHWKIPLRWKECILVSTRTGFPSGRMKMYSFSAGEATAPEKMPQAGDMPVCAGWHSAIGRKAVKLPPGLHRIA